ncbi:hypothetical protein EVAR_60689_1 [Eumeta japonica]|uniref:Uncharacterized protein n=1 Tax=Eumeta variegata TaxID=151549 RepID=A0A4C1ZI30_EUMVA|nr:hypothetical protein EVAR_60689_1 [Eumeta japonica]
MVPRCQEIICYGDIKLSYSAHCQMRSLPRGPGFLSLIVMSALVTVAENSNNITSRHTRKYLMPAETEEPCERAGIREGPVARTRGCDAKVTLFPRSDITGRLMKMCRPGRDTGAGERPTPIYNNLGMYNNKKF